MLNQRVPGEPVVGSIILGQRLPSQKLLRRILLRQGHFYKLCGAAISRHSDSIAVDKVGKTRKGN